MSIKKLMNVIQLTYYLLNNIKHRIITKEIDTHLSLKSIPRDCPFFAQNTSIVYENVKPLFGCKKITNQTK